MTVVAADLQQVLAGLPVDVCAPTDCRRCGRALREGAPVALVVDRVPGSTRWTITARYCTDCGFDGAGESTALRYLATLGRASDASTQSSWPIAVDPTPIAALREPED